MEKSFEDQNVNCKRYFSLAFDNFGSKLLLYEFMFTKMTPKETLIMHNYVRLLLKS